LLFVLCVVCGLLVCGVVGVCGGWDGFGCVCFLGGGGGGGGGGYDVQLF